MMPMDNFQQVQLWWADVSSSLHETLQRVMPDDDTDSNVHATNDVSATRKPPLLRPIREAAKGLNKLKGQLEQSCNSWKDRITEIQVQADNQVQLWQHTLQESLQARRRPVRILPGTGCKRRRARGVQLVRAAGQQHSTPVAAKVGASSASGVGASKNALAGGLAGGLVALSLYPVDTIKTLVQAETGAGQRSIPRIFQKLMEKHGAFGLYRGLGSNLVTATPISAIYASTYEAVKELLLPHLSPRFHSVAHCGAGAAASVATSFVFTPSEVVKQRMQYTSQYNNSWAAFLGILRTEGLPALYNGWGAVLARNIPNSIIKFYTYESLKKIALDRRPGATRLTQVESLVIGGVAGVSAAFCTTPFDVVKTRLQNQMPGQTIHYSGVTECLQKILAEEGLPGLYRGVGPRLFIYVSQGAIFFASYEVLRRVLQDDWHVTNRGLVRINPFRRVSAATSHQGDKDASKVS